MPSEAIEALLRAVDDGDHLAGCECLRMFARDCSCNLREITRAAAAVRAELAREPVELGEDELCGTYRAAVNRAIEAGVASTAHWSGLRAVARAAKGEKP